MSFKSRSQRKKFYALKAEGKMDQKTIDEWEKDTPKNIPERLPKKSLKKKAFEKRASIRGTIGALKYLVPQGFNNMFGGTFARTLGGATLGGIAGGATAPGGSEMQGLMRGAALGAGIGFAKKPAAYLLGKGNKTMGKLMRYSPLALGGGIAAGASTQPKQWR